jgi:hypothetical protein
MKTDEVVVSDAHCRLFFALLSGKISRSGNRM